MCTAIHVKTEQGSMFLGRTLDFSYVLDPQIYVVSKGYQWHNIVNTHIVKTHYSFLAIGQDISPVTFVDGVNEAGFAIAALYFPEYAMYDSIDLQDTKSPSIAASELTKLLLSTCASVEQASQLVHKIRIVGIQDSVTNSIAPLHWIMADKSGVCKVIEKTAEGLYIMDNPIGVLTNSPTFTWQMTNLRNYMNISPFQKENIKFGEVELTPFGQAGGTFGLPGDFTPPSRFVRSAYLKTHTVFPKTKKEAITTCFHIMDSVSILKGVVMTSRDTSDYTQYTVFMDLHALEYFYKTYDNNEIRSIKLMDVVHQKEGIVAIKKLNRPISFR